MPGNKFADDEQKIAGVERSFEFCQPQFGEFFFAFALGQNYLGLNHIIFFQLYFLFVFVMRTFVNRF